MKSNVQKTLAMYIRISLEDLDVKKSKVKDESNSISNQRDLIHQYIKQHPEFAHYQVMEFCDDGFSGTHFDRPQFNLMVDLVREKKIDCIIVKDLSRLGRDHIEVGDYIEQIFPLLNVRLISINDEYDSSDTIGKGVGIDIPLRNLIYELYSKDLSQKVRSAQQSKMSHGRYVNYAPYGYKPSVQDKHILTPDEPAASVVRQIFKWASDGVASTEIARRLNATHTPPRRVYRKIEKRPEYCCEQSVSWTYNAVIDVIQNEKYTGCMVYHKRTTHEVGDGKSYRVPKDEWRIVENTHEPLVSKQTFQAANASLTVVSVTAKKKRSVQDNVYVCAHCGRKLQRTMGLDHYFMCRHNINRPNEACGGIHFSRRDMEKVLLSAFSAHINLIQNRAAMLKQEEAQAHTPAWYMKRIDKLEQELQKLKRRKAADYSRYRSGELSKEAFLTNKQELTKIMEEVEAEKQTAQVQYEASLRSDTEASNVVREAQFLPDVSSENQGAVRAEMYQSIEKVIVTSNHEIEIVWKLKDCFKELLKPSELVERAKIVVG